MSTSVSPALVLNADFQPLSYYPLSLCSWQDAVKYLEHYYSDKNRKKISIK